MKKLFQRMDSVSIRMLFSYLSILLVPLCIVVALYSTAMDAILVSRQETALKGLKESASIMSVRLEELGNISSYLYTDSNTNAIINRSRFEQKNRNIYAFYEAINALPHYKLTNQMIENVFIFFNKAEFVIKQPNAFEQTENNYYKHADFHGISYEEILDLSGHRYVGGLLVSEDARGRDVLLMRSIPNTSSPEGLIVIQINTAIIDGIMGTNDVGPGGAAFILNRDNMILSQTGDGTFDHAYLLEIMTGDSMAYSEVTYQGKQYLFCQVYADGLTYLTLTAKDHLLSTIAPIKDVMMIIGGLALALGGVICLLLWRRRRKVVKNITMTAQSVGVDFQQARSETSLLESTVSSLASTVGSLRETMDRQQDALAQTVVQGCLLGSFPSRADMMREVSSVNLSLTAASYHVVRVLLLDPWEVRKENTPILPYRIFLKEFIAAHLAIPHVITDVDGISFAVLLMEQRAYTSRELEGIFQALSAQVGQQDWVVPSFAISGSCVDLWDVSSLYAQTNEVTGYMALLERSGVFSAEALPQATDTICFPVDVEIRLIRVIKTGTAGELESIYQQIMDENLAGRTLSAAMLGELFEALRRSILRAVQESGTQTDISAAMDTLSAIKSFADLRAYAGRVQEHLSRAAETQTREEDLQIKEQLERYIDESLANPAFNLSMLSEMAGISESTLYRTFKDYFGMSFSSYLEQRRINKAFELLKDQVLIKDVAEQVGYISDHTFRRAFKRVMKVPPSEFAKL